MRPNCECHDHPMVKRTYRDKVYWYCAIRYRRKYDPNKYRESRARYLASSKGKAAKRKKERKYLASPKGKRAKSQVMARRRERESSREWIEEFDLDAPCPVCGKPIEEGEHSVGHEPPICREEIPGPGIKRWEHLDCNIRKGRSTDAELCQSPF